MRKTWERNGLLRINDGKIAARTKLKDELVAWCPDASLQQVCSSQEWKESIKGHRESQAKKPDFFDPLAAWR